MWISVPCSFLEYSKIEKHNSHYILFLFFIGIGNVGVSRKVVMVIKFITYCVHCRLGRNNHQLE